jgi:hypothetical protein
MIQAVRNYVWGNQATNVQAVSQYPLYDELSKMHKFDQANALKSLYNTHLEPSEKLTLKGRVSELELQLKEIQTETNQWATTLKIGSRILTGVCGVGATIVEIVDFPIAVPATLAVIGAGALYVSTSIKDTKSAEKKEKEEPASVPVDIQQIQTIIQDLRSTERAAEADALQQLLDEKQDWIHDKQKIHMLESKITELEEMKKKWLVALGKGVIDSVQGIKKVFHR